MRLYFYFFIVIIGLIQKYERQKEKDKTLDLTEKLDKEWKHIIPLIGGMVAKNKIEEEIANEANANKVNKAHDYDVLVRSLQFDSQKAKVYQ